MKIEFINKSGLIGCEIKNELTVNLLSAMLNDIGLIKEGVEIDKKSLFNWVSNLNNGIMVISPNKLLCGIRAS